MLFIMVSFTMQILIKIGLNPAELWPKPFLLGQLLFVFSCPLGQLLAGPSIRKPRYGLGTPTLIVGFPKCSGWIRTNVFCHLQAENICSGNLVSE